MSSMNWYYTLCTFGVGLFKNILKKKFKTFLFQQN